MKIEKFSVSVAAKDGMSYTEILDRLTKANRSVDYNCGIYAIEFEQFDPYAGKAKSEANEEPRQKRKYTRRPKAPQNAEKGAGTAACGGVKVRRIRSEGGVVEMRGNCQGGYAKAEGN